MSNTSEKKVIKVVAAIIHKENYILATQRGYGDFQGGWEFPGGKIELGETKEESLIREIKEELDVTVKVGQLFHTVNYEYPKFHLIMDCYLCTIESGKLVLHEHEAIKWLDAESMDSVVWLPADIEVKDKVKIELLNIIN